MRLDQPPGPPDVVSSFLAHVRNRPQATALVWRHIQITYQQLYRRACDAQARLNGLELAPGAPVAVRAVKCPDTIALILALLADGRPVLLPPADLADATLTAVLSTAGCETVLTPEHDAAPTEHELRTTPTSADEVRFMLTTSGSTGVPKVVPLTAGAINRFTGWASAKFQLGPQRTVLNYAPLNFDLCLLDIWSTLAAGGQVVLVEADHATRGAYLYDLLDRHQVHVVQAVPMLYHLLIEHGGALPAATHVISTGDALTERGLAGLPKLFPNAKLYNLYGCTETNDSFLHEIDPTADHAPLPLGQPIDGVEAVLVDSAGSVLTGTGVGELHVSTPFQTPGYTDPVLAAAAFAPHPAGADDRPYFRSGDLVRRHANGSLTLEGRADFHVKVRGVRVNTQSVERALLELGAVAGAVVIAVPDVVAGNTLHAVIHRRAPESLHSLAVRAHCAERLPRQAVPTAIHLVDEPLPTTSTGKPDRARIKRIYLKGQK